MERGKDKASAAAVAGESAEQSGGAGEYAKVMTDEQVEVLRKQISIYATLCDQLLEAHRARIAHQEYIAGVRLGSNPYRDRPPTAVHGGGRKTTGRQRWAPTPMQLQILETIFGQGNGVLPGRQKVQDITAELSRHGQVVAETSVYNWFQNRRARVKRNLKLKQAASMPDRT